MQYVDFAFDDFAVNVSANPFVCLGSCDGVVFADVGRELGIATVFTIHLEDDFNAVFLQFTFVKYWPSCIRDTACMAEESPELFGDMRREWCE